MKAEEAIVKTKEAQENLHSTCELEYMPGVWAVIEEAIKYGLTKTHYKWDDNWSKVAIEILKSKGFEASEYYCAGYYSVSHYVNIAWPTEEEKQQAEEKLIEQKKLNKRHTIIGISMFIALITSFIYFTHR